MTGDAAQILSSARAAFRTICAAASDLDLGASSAGPAMTAMRTLIACIAIILPGNRLAEMLAQVIIWHSFYLAGPWLLWGPRWLSSWSPAR